MNTVILHNTTGNHYKQYRIILDGTTVRLRWGKINGTLQSQMKFFGSEAQASQFARDQQLKKMENGYELVSSNLTVDISPEFQQEIDAMRKIESGAFA